MNAFQKSLCTSALDESSLSIAKVKPVLHPDSGQGQWAAYMMCTLNKWVYFYSILAEKKLLIIDYNAADCSMLPTPS